MGATLACTTALGRRPHDLLLLPLLLLPLLLLLPMLLQVCAHAWALPWHA
jgi:hypothetical protein